MILNEGNGQPTHKQRLTGWRDIAAYFGRNESTVKRWAAERNLPVYRAGGKAKRGVLVHAYSSELEAWLRADKGGQASEAEDGPTADVVNVVPIEPARRQHRTWIAAAVAGLVLIGAVGWFAGVLPGTATRDNGGQAQAAEIPEEARELYLRGTYLWNRRTPEGIEGAIETLARAIEIHPDFAEAHAGLAMTYNLARQYSGMSGFDAYPKAEEHARRAVELDPTSGFAQSVLAFVEFHWLWDVEAGLGRFEEALRLDPDDGNTLMWYASSLILAGRAADAMPPISKAQEADPDSTSIINTKAQALFYNGRVDEAIALLDEIKARDPAYAWAYYAIYSIHAAHGDHARYLENYARLGDMTGLPRYRVVAEAGLRALETSGVEAMGRAMIAVETEYFERGEALAWDVARHHAMMGEVEEAIRWLRISLERREERLIGLLVDTAFWPIRDAPDFKQLVADIGLPTSL